MDRASLNRLSHRHSSRNFIHWSTFEIRESDQLQNYWCVSYFFTEKYILQLKNIVMSVFWTLSWPPNNKKELLTDCRIFGACNIVSLVIWNCRVTKKFGCKNWMFTLVVVFRWKSGQCMFLPKNIIYHFNILLPHTHTHTNTHFINIQKLNKYLFSTIRSKDSPVEGQRRGWGEFHKQALRGQAEAPMADTG